MRGNYYSDTNQIERDIANAGKPRLVDVFMLEPKHMDEDNRPQVIASPDTVSQPADVRAIVTYVAMQEFKASWDFDSGHEDMRFVHKALKGLTNEQIERVIEEALA